VKKLVKKYGSMLVLATVLTTIFVAPFAYAVVVTNEPTGKLAWQAPITIIKAIATWVLGFVAIIAVIIIIIGGFQYMAAGGAEETTAAAKNRIVYGVIGLVICVAAWIIVRLVASFIESGGAPT